MLTMTYLLKSKIFMVRFPVSYIPSEKRFVLPQMTDNPKRVHANLETLSPTYEITYVPMNFTISTKSI